MGLVRFIELNTIVGVIDIVGALLSLFLIIWIRVDKTKVHYVSNILIVAAYVVFFSLFLLAPSQYSRIAVFTILIGIAFFLKGIHTGFIWLVVLIVSISGVQFSGIINTGYTNQDILVMDVYLITLFFILNAYESVQKVQKNSLLKLNENLDLIVKNKTEELLKANKKLKEDKELFELLSTTDALTGLYNRRKLESELKTQCNGNNQVSIILIDLDHFKSVNDTYGHDVGDTYLKVIAKIIKVYGVSGRWGGEEFLIILPNHDSESAREIAEEIRIAIENHNIDSIVTQSASIGVTSWIENESTVEFLKRVDNALYEAKEGGRNRVVLK